MRLRIAALVLIAWLIGVGCGLGYVAVSGGWYEYHDFSTGSATEATVAHLINAEGWQHVDSARAHFLYLRRPRFRLPSLTP